MQELDNKDSRVIERERCYLDEELRKINTLLKVIQVDNHDTYTDFILPYQSFQFEEQISSLIGGKYEGGTTNHMFDLLEGKDSSSSSSPLPKSIPVSKRTLYIRRHALIPYKRPLKATACLQVSLLIFIVYACWLIYRIIK